ncbi:MAG: AAA family ATPase [Treponema sp.]|nr:AAA family ATPase [Treponema sp.]MCL2273076.1 AAA family ATPase [Treponema sp.]
MTYPYGHAAEKNIEIKYFKRNIDEILLTWSREKPPYRKPLLMRGARQVGKSSAVRHLGKCFKHYIEINFDENKDIGAFFDSPLHPQKICEKLALYYHIPVIPGETLLFFDEIQTCQPALMKLRYFYEKYPELHVAAAGSLLEFALEETASFGVGRIRSLFMYPFAFDEFLYAVNDEGLAEEIKSASPDKPMAELIHHLLLERFKIFLICGGMPEVVSQYIQKQDLLGGELVLNDLITILKTDFAKYRKRTPLLLLNEVFESVMRQAGGKFVYERAAPGTPGASIRQALDLLIMAGLAHPVTHTAANGIPLGAEKNVKYRRIIPCDTGIFLHTLGMRSEILPATDFSAVNRGSLAEIFTGLELLKAASCYTPSELYCWQRSANHDSPQGSAQIDFLVQKGSKIIPIEVKSGTQGSMQSLRLFMKEKRIDRGIRTSLENFGRYENIDIYPLYAIGNLVKDR